MANILNIIKTFFSASDFYKETIDTRNAISKMAKKLTALNEKITELVEIATEIKEKAVFQPVKEEPTLDKKYFYYKDKSGHLYCPSCYDDKQKLINLHPCDDPNYGWECFVCEKIIKNPDYKSPKQRQPSKGMINRSRGY